MRMKSGSEEIAMKHYKPFILSLVLILIVASFIISPMAMEADKQSNNVLLRTSEQIEPRAYIHYTKTVTRYYPNLSSIPEEIEYSEYNNTLQAWFSGTLVLSRIDALGNGTYNAIFTGEIYGNA